MKLAFSITSPLGASIVPSLALGMLLMQLPEETVAACVSLLVMLRPLPEEECEPNLSCSSRLQARRKHSPARVKMRQMAAPN